jgi:hypothetical protein
MEIEGVKRRKVSYHAHHSLFAEVEPGVQVSVFGGCESQH